MRDLDIMDEYCQSGQLKLLDNLSSNAVALLIDGCFECLFQKYGYQKLAINTLIHYEQIKRVANSWVYTGSFDGLNTYHQLQRVGVISVPVLEKSELAGYRKKFMTTLRTFPEYRRDPANPDLDASGNPLVYVLGGFAALGNPASFHNDMVRDLRLRARGRLVSLFRNVIKRYANKNLRNNTKLEILFDRMLYRMVSQAPVPESWHRDVMPKDKIEKRDEVFGGWINLDDKDQYFSCIPGSHLGVILSKLEPGFATIPKDEVKIIGIYRYKFRVPPGHIVLFPQYILHEVVNQKASHNMMRLFTGWRLTVSNTYLYPETEDRMDRQAIMPIPGGMFPPMYAANHGSYYLWKPIKPIPNQEHRVNLIQWSNNSMNPITLINRPAKGDKPAYKVVKRYMDSLEEYGMPKYKPYTKEEKRLYKPTKLMFSRNKITLIPSVYKGPGKYGDFEWMIRQPEYDKVLFIFNDNEESFLRSSGAKGKGNAVIRPSSIGDAPRSAGIPTGYYVKGKINHGYTSLSDGRAKKIIDLSITKIRNLLATGRYDTVMYSGNSNGELGSSIFVIGSDVKEYIVKELQKLVS